MGTVDGGLSERLASIVMGLGYEFVGCEWHREGGVSSLRIYIEKPGGVTLTDCTMVSRQVSAVLDVEERVGGHYCLEVSSPGVNRPLFDLSQYQQQIGNEVALRLRVPEAGRRQIKGRLLSASEHEGICIGLATGEQVVVPFASVARANLVADVFSGRGQKSGQTGSKKGKKRLMS